MEFTEGKSIPVVKEFQIEGSWGPVTPVKPTLPRSRPIYEEGQGGLLSQAIMRESQDFLSRFSQLNQTRTQTQAQAQAQAQAQTLLSCSISSMERNIQNTPNMNNYIWDRENVELQRQGLEEYLPHWSNQGRRTMPSYGLANPGPSSYPCLSSSWDLPLSWKNNGVRENASMLGCNSNDSLAQGLSLSWKNNGIRENAISILEGNSDDPLAQFDNMSFRDLLAMKGSAFEPSMISTRLGDSVDATINSLFPGNTLGSSSTFRNQEAIQDLNQQINGIFGQEMENSVFPHQKWNYSDVNSTPVKKHADGKNTTLSPPTPDLLWRAESSAMSGNTNLRTPQKQNEHNGSEENEDAAAVIINLQDLNTTEVTEHATNSPGQISAILDENHNLDKGDLDLNKTPQKKTRRKRYLPKVVNENKPKRTPKPKTPKPTDSKDPPRTRRKYVRKNKTNSPSTSSPNEATKTIDPKPTEPAVKSCKRSLKFDLNGQVTENNSLHKPNGDLHAETQPNDRHTAGNQFSSTVRLRQGEELVVQTSRVGIAYDLNYTLNQELKNYMALPEQHNVASLHADQRILTKEREKVTRSLLEAGTEEALRTDLAQSPNSSPCASSNEGVQTRGSKRARSSITDTTNVDTEDAAVNHSKFWQPNHIFLNNADIREVPGIHFPEICKKRRTDKGQRSHTASISYSAAASEELRQAANAQNHPRVDPTASKYYYCNSVPYGTNAVTNNQVEMLMRSAKNQVQLLNTWLDISRLKRKKRSKGTTRVRDLASLEGIASVSSMRPAIKGTRRRKTVNLNSPYLGNSSYVNESYSVYSSMEALAEEVHEGPQSKRRNRKGNSVVNSRCSKSKNRWGLVLYDGNQSIKNRRASSAKVRLVKTVSLEAITEGLELLNINRESSKVSRQEHNALVPYRVKNTQQNALVPYGNDGTLVPFEGLFDPIKRRRQRAKVDLDDETSRVWRLLLENIDNEGIDGTDEEKAKWWENERGVFRGRVSSFIARMRLVQGDRRFTPWKGSVLDSVIGVFLTQNVSDHLSSSAFMSLAARFPIKSDSCESTLSEEATSALAVEPEVCVIEPEESITWNEKSLDQPVRDWKSRVIYSLDQIEEKEVVNSKEIIGAISGSIRNESRANKADSHTEETEAASIQGDDRARDDATSSQQSVISSQNSTDSPNLQTGGVTSTVSESNSREQALTSNANCNYFDCSTSFMGLLKLAESPLLHDSYSQIFEQDQPEFFKLVAKDSVDAPGILSSDYQLHQRSDFHINATTEQSLATEPTVQPFMKEKDFTPRSSPENVCSCYVLEGEQMIMQSQSRSRKDSPDNVVSSTQQQSNSIWKSLNVPNSLQEAADVTESTTALNRVNNDHKGVEQISKNQTGGSSEITNADSTIPKKGKAGKDKKNAYDWDNLRKQAQVNGCKKERPANTRDSIDWEAVMRADVSEISETIKERGMNNMLAERIKDLLDRLIKDHGSIDLEWLRDIPPDKAKEYLLSFRGLGLKSVECVRLLTLHHLAFPVDTNVGRIAVRLGWVPLQPLPEQLQLHLLELYPVLESIQKYLWPRLCKLDQKTLYELHYHMITFGKVFCTKRQPNCNACPLRGECRHFASAFASARLALPGPEERGIVASGRGSSMHVNPQININPLPLPPWSNHCTETNIRSDKGAPTVEVPSTPLSLLMPQPIHHLERKSQVNCEPIVEIPASPEPEPEQDQALCDIEDTFYEDPNEIPTIKLNMKEFTQTLQNFMEANRELQETGMSRALVALTPEIASIPTPKLKNISRLRTEHHVYELPDTHPLLKGMDKREPDDPCSYLLAIWTPGETADSIQPPERRCNFNDPSILCNEETCSYCSSQREANSQIVRGTLLIPCRTAMRGSFPLNGTYFQVNEVFADHDSSLNPIEVPRSWLWNLPRRTVYFGTSVPTIFRGLTTEEIQHCFWRGYVCVRGFDQTTRAPRPLMARLHFPASKMPRGGKGKSYDE